LGVSPETMRKGLQVSCEDQVLESLKAKGNWESGCRGIQKRCLKSKTVNHSESWSISDNKVWG
jgi:hypothetical protein